MPKKSTLTHIGILAVTLIFTFGCAKKYGPYPIYSHPPAPEEQETVVVLSQDLVDKIGCEGELVHIPLPDGRLEVSAKIRNLTRYPLHVQAQTVFKDEDGFDVGETTAWYDLLLNEHETQNYKSVSFTDKAKGYTIRIRRLVRPKPME